MGVLLSGPASAGGLQTATHFAAKSRAASTVTNAQSSLAPPNARLRREVLGFVNARALGDPSVGYPSWNLGLLSTVVFFAIHVNSGNGSLVGDTDGSIYHSETMSNFVRAAHAAGVRVIVSLNLHDFSTDPNNLVCTGLQASVAQNTINQAVDLVKWAGPPNDLIGIDGINVDYEGTITTCANGLSNRDEMTSFVKNLRAAMAPGSYLAIDTYSGSAEDNLEFFDVTGLAAYVDSFFVMAYDMDFVNAQEVPLNCTSYCMNPVSPVNTYRWNVSKSMAQYTALVPSSKVILGQPYYGSRACVFNTTDAHQYPTSNFVSTTYLYASTVATQTGVHGFVAHRDPGDGISEWDTWYDSDWNCNREQYFDDVQSLGAKYDVVNADNLRGVGLFTLDYGGGAPELWKELDLKFGTPTPWYLVGGTSTSSPDASSSAANATDVFVRGTDNALWHRSWNGTSWSAWESLGGYLVADPSAVSQGPNQIDVFVIGTDSGVWHRAWNGTVWSAWDTIGGRATSAPDSASWGAGRLDVVVRGTNSGLFHRSWNGTTWSAWDAVGGLATSDPSITASGSGRVDVFVRGTDSGLWHRSGDGTGAWGAWESLGGVLPVGPDAASCTSGHLDVFATGTDGGLWQRGFDGTSWGAWTPLRGQWTARPGAVCPTGTVGVNVFERGPDSSIWQTIVPAS
jgi:spore germination protein YaaH